MRLINSVDPWNTYTQSLSALPIKAFFLTGMMPANILNKMYKKQIKTQLTNNCFVFAAHIAVPDFGGGAMENWGLIIYRETSLLFQEGSSTAQQRQRVAVVVSHELAHMVSVYDHYSDLQEHPPPCCFCRDKRYKQGKSLRH